MKTWIFVGLIVFGFLSQFEAKAANCPLLFHQFKSKVDQLHYAQSIIETPDRHLSKILHDDSRGSKSLGGLALTFIEKETNLLDMHTRASVWEQFARDIHTKYPDWDSVGPFQLKDGSLAFQGTKGVVLIFRADNHQAYLFAHESTGLLEWNIRKDYDYLISLKMWLKNRNRKK